MKTHHQAWRSHHHDRTQAWLKERLRDGFDVHHLDGDHSNNDPANLVLIEAADHMRLHGMDMRVVKRLTSRGGGRPKGSYGPNGKLAYETKVETGAAWKDIGDLLGIKAASAMSIAKDHALRLNLPWPIREDIAPATPEERKVDPYKGIKRRYHHLTPERARYAQWFNENTDPTARYPGYSIDSDATEARAEPL